MKNNPGWTYINSTDQIGTRDLGPQPPMGAVPKSDPEADMNGVGHNISQANSTKYLWSSEGSNDGPNKDS